MLLRWKPEMELTFCMIVSIVFLCIACNSNVSYTPPFGIVSFSISNTGISCSAGSTIVTPIGEFSYQYTLASMNVEDDAFVIDIRYSKNGVITDGVYKIQTNNDEVTVTTNGHTRIQISNRRVLIDASTSTVQTVEVRDAQSSAPDPVTPEQQAQSVIDRYYTAINNKDYQTAYDLWLNHPAAYQNFANGFADTSHDDYTVDNIVSQSNGTVWVYITLQATSTSYQQTTYQGYYIVSSQSDGSWKISGANVRKI